LGIFSSFRSLVEALDNIAVSISELTKCQSELGPGDERLHALEVSRHLFEAECQGMLLKADGKLKAASNAEARERQLKRSYERDLDPFDEAGNEGSKADPVRTVDAPGGEAEGLPPVRLALATNDKSHAIAAKWGR